MISPKEKIKEVQRALGTYPDGIIGAHTADVLYRQFASPKLPYEGKFFGCHVIIGNPNYTTPIDTQGKYGVGAFSFAMSGSFTYPSGKSPCSILVNAGKVYRRESCHYPAWDGRFPETVLWYEPDGTYGMSLVELADELPGGPESKAWAIGGGQIVKHGEPVFNAKEEGFTSQKTSDVQNANTWFGKFADVARKTAHAAIGFDQFGNVLGVMHSYCTLEDFQNRLIKIGMVDGIFIDGGSVVAMNAGTIRRKVNQRQGYIIQF